MTDVLEILLELECLEADLIQDPLKGDLPVLSWILLGRLVTIMDMILKGTTSKDSLAHLEQISSGDMT